MARPLAQWQTHSRSGKCIRLLADTLARILAMFFELYFILEPLARCQMSFAGLLWFYETSLAECCVVVEFFC